MNGPALRKRRKGDHNTYAERNDIHAGARNRRRCGTGRERRTGEGPLQEGYKGIGRTKGAPQGRKTVTGGETHAAANKTATVAKKGRKAGKQTSHKPAATKRGGDKAERSNKKAEVIAMMKRASGATLAEIVVATGWQKHYADVRIMPTCVGNSACGAGIAAMESA